HERSSAVRPAGPGIRLDTQDRSEEQRIPLRSSGFDPITSELIQVRLRRVLYVVFLAFAVLVLRLWLLQVVHGPEYRVKSESNRIHLRDIPPFRGMIFDRGGHLLVDNRPAYNLYVIPEEIRDPESLLERLEELAGIDREAARSRLSKAGRGQPFRPVLIERDLERETLAVVESHRFNLPGVMIQVKPQRHYIRGDLAAHVIGYLGEISETQLRSGRYPENRPGDLIGKSGVEAQWQQDLHGARGGEQVEVDAAGRQLKVLSRKPPVPGLNLSLTLDNDLQTLAEKGLEGKKGAIVAMDPRTGEILAMASAPAFDPNIFIGGIDHETWKRMISGGDYPLQNRVISGQYPPGSIFKIVVGLAGLEEGLVDPEEEVSCSGRYRLGSHTFRCWKRYGHGKVAFHRALRESCDVYFYRLGRRLGVDRIAHYSHMLGLGKRTGLNLGSERPGLIPTSQWKLKRFGVPWQAGETISTSIGQSFVLVTPIQAARVIGAVFNGGILHQPKVVRWVGKGGGVRYRFEPTVLSRLDVAPENLERIQRALIGVVNEPHGTGGRAKVKGVTVAGKTGTAQVVNLETEKAGTKDNKVLEKYRDHAWFVAVAPAGDPKLAIAVLMENAGHGGSVAAPIAGRMIQAYLGEGTPDRDATSEKQADPEDDRAPVER
ncbi:MAG: penicillin-binding protein 2, partial [Deltaproteobacteria bacterium]|nr:penicillin-binding protein 2 [Deltaproteobacteria bacterium]